MSGLMSGFAVLAAVLMSASRALAWETAGGGIEKRVNELDHAWASLDHDETNEDIIVRSRQARRPGWVGQKSWQASQGGKSYGFGVGSCRGDKKPEKRIQEAETSARTELGSLMGKERVAAAILDWYTSPDGKFYALAAVEFAGAPLASAPEKPAKAPPMTIDGYLARADAAIDSGLYPEAENDLAVAATGLKDDDKRKVRYFERRGLVALKTKDLAGAQGLYTQGIHLARTLGVRGPLKAELFAGMASSLAAAKRTDYARKFFDKALELDPSDATRKRVERALRDLPKD